MDAPTASGDIESRRARTGAPACASTALIPRVRSMVLLPDMLDPLTTITCSAPPRRISLRTTLSSASSGWPKASASIQGPSGTNSGNGSAGCSKAWLASEHSASISPAACSPRRSTRLRPPIFHLYGQMGRPQDEGLQDADHDVVARIEVLHQSLETRQLAR